MQVIPIGGLTPNWWVGYKKLDFGRGPLTQTHPTPRNIPFVQQNGTSRVPYDEAIPIGHAVTDEDPPPGFVNFEANCRVGPCAREAGYGVNQP